MNHLKLYEFSQTRHMIAGFGNPLLDFSAPIGELKILEKYNLKLDGQKEVNNGEFSAILASLRGENNKVTFNPGGCVQNTLRIIQALVQYPSFCVFFGGLGDDEEGSFLELEVNRSGVDTRYAKHSMHPTGKVIALINGENRSLVAHLGAAEVYRMQDFIKPDNLKVIKEVSIVYIEGFFITHSCDVALEAINLCNNEGVVVSFNISGAYVAETYPQELLAVATAADIIIGNADELKALANVMGLEIGVIEDLALKVYSSLWVKDKIHTFKLHQMERFGKTLIITQGKNSIYCICGDKSLIKFKVPYLDPKLVKDPTGAGDAFAAGFLVAFLQNKPATECLTFGCAVAQHIIQNIGVQMQN